MKLPGVSNLRRTRGPHLVFLDLAMPSMDGFAVAKAIRRLDIPAFKLFAMTGYGDEHTRAKVEAGGFDGFLLKPIDLQQLKVIVGLS